MTGQKVEAQKVSSNRLKAGAEAAAAAETAAEAAEAAAKNPVLFVAMRDLLLFFRIHL